MTEFDKLELIFKTVGGEKVVMDLNKIQEGMEKTKEKTKQTSNEFADMAKNVGGLLLGAFSAYYTTILLRSPAISLHLAIMGNSLEELGWVMGDYLEPMFELIGEGLEWLLDLFYSLPEPIQKVIAYIVFFAGAIGTMGLLGQLLKMFSFLPKLIGMIFSTTGISIAAAFLGVYAIIKGGIEIWKQWQEQGTISVKGIMNVLSGLALLIGAIMLFIPGMQVWGAGLIAVGAIGMYGASKIPTGTAVPGIGTGQTTYNNMNVNLATNPQSTSSLESDLHSKVTQRWRSGGTSQYSNTSRA